MNTEWVNHRIAILREANVARDAEKRGLWVAEGERAAVDAVVALAWDQLKRGLAADD